MIHSPKWKNTSFLLPEISMKALCGWTFYWAKNSVSNSRGIELFSETPSCRSVHVSNPKLRYKLNSFALTPLPVIPNTVNTNPFNCLSQRCNTITYTQYCLLFPKIDSSANALGHEKWKGRGGVLNSLALLWSLAELQKTTGCSMSAVIGWNRGSGWVGPRTEMTFIRKQNVTE